MTPTGRRATAPRTASIRGILEKPVADSGYGVAGVPARVRSIRGNDTTPESTDMRTGTRVLIIAAAGAVCALGAGCNSDQKTDASEHPAAEHPAGDGEHPTGDVEHPASEHPQGDHPASEHPDHPGD